MVTPRNNHKRRARGFERRYADLSPEDRETLDHFFDRYISLVIRIHERLTEDRGSHGGFGALTGEQEHRNLGSQRSSITSS